ncbi:MAG: hypothetical protein BGP12_18610 [Rhodospirillales bacterium 70-18]|nr:hypothetical protein [Rhodospirillales bacterium]OJY65847.1 MAG: hypothetical protein BGP12_18610 [Rhodospirillales bacterium 70-18]
MSSRFACPVLRVAALLLTLCGALAPCGAARAAGVTPAKQVLSEWSPASTAADPHHAPRLFSVPNVAVVTLGLTWVVLMRRRRR